MATTSRAALGTNRTKYSIVESICECYSAFFNLRINTPFVCTRCRCISYPFPFQENKTSNPIYGFSYFIYLLVFSCRPIVNQYNNGHYNITRSVSEIYVRMLSVCCWVFIYNLCMYKYVYSSLISSQTSD